MNYKQQRSYDIYYFRNLYLEIKYTSRISMNYDFENHEHNY